MTIENQSLLQQLTTIKTGTAYNVASVIYQRICVIEGKIRQELLLSRKNNYSQVPWSYNISASEMKMCDSS